MRGGVIAPRRVSDVVEVKVENSSIGCAIIISCTVVTYHTISRPRHPPRPQKIEILRVGVGHWATVKGKNVSARG